MLRKPNMIEPTNYKDWASPNTKWAIGLLFLFVFTVFGYNLYKSYVESTSDIRYTIINFNERYTDSKRVGMKVSYLAEGKNQYDNCFSNKCKRIKTGERRLGYYFVNDPRLYQIIYDTIVPDSVVVPNGGWEEIPDFLKPQPNRID
jgi:hypothetical protein